MEILKKIPVPHGQTAGRVYDGEAVLMLADAGENLMLNSVGSRIFELSNGSHSVAGIVGVIVDEFEVDEERATADVIEFIESFVRDKILVLVSPDQVDQSLSSAS